MLRLRFHEDLTQVEIGRRVGCSQMQVSRILRAALAQLADNAGADPVAWAADSPRDLVLP